MSRKIEDNHLFSEIRQLIEQSRQQIAVSVNFAQTFPDEKIVSTLWRQLTLSHIKGILYMDGPAQTGILY